MLPPAKKASDLHRTAFLCLQPRTSHQERLLNDTEEQVKLLHGLKDRNLTSYIGLLKTILQNPSAHPVVKTMILQLLAESDHDFNIGMSSGLTVSVGLIVIESPNFATSVGFSWSDSAKS